MNYRKITAFVKPTKLEIVEDRLKQIGVPNMCVSTVQGYGEYRNLYHSDWTCECSQIDLFVESSQADEVAREIMDSAHSGLDDDGIIVVLPVESIYKIRTKKKLD